MEADAAFDSPGEGGVNASAEWTRGVQTVLWVTIDQLPNEKRLENGRGLRTLSDDYSCDCGEDPSERREETAVTHLVMYGVAYVEPRWSRAVLS